MRESVACYYTRDSDRHDLIGQQRGVAYGWCRPGDRYHRQDSAASPNASRRS